MDFKMLNCIVQPSCAQPQLQRSSFGVSFIWRTIYSRKHLNWKYKAIDMSSSWKLGAINASLAIRLKASQPQRLWVPMCHCVGSLMNPEYVASVNWVPLIDQVLLTTSILLAYMAGVVPRDKALLNSRKNMVDKDASASNSTISGRYGNSKTHPNMKDAWNEVKDKLLDAMDAFDHDGNLYNSAVEQEKFSANRPLSLHAISGAPRLRLLCTTLQHLQKEITDLPESHKDYSRDAWLARSSELIQGSVQPICTEWLAGELSLENKEQDKELLISILERLDRNDSVLQKVNRLEKMNLYADLFFFLRFGPLSTNSSYNDNILTMSCNDILEDLVVTLADGISSTYLELISVDSNLSSEINGLGLSLCSLSTRALQKLRNEVALNAWLLENFESVVSMYEDRFELCILQRKSSVEPETSKTENFDWWKKILFSKKAASTSTLHYILITHSPMFVKRTKELRALTGWRYYYSLFLEFSDITMPLVRAVFIKVRDAISFFFTCLIGRSLGLIYTGIRQSFSWR